MAIDTKKNHDQIMPRRHFIGGALVAPLLVTACGAPKLNPAISTRGGRIYLAVASVNAINAYHSPAAKPNIDHLFSPTLGEKLVNWGTSTLIPDSDKGKVTMTVTNASVTETDRDQGEGIRSFFTNEQRLTVEAKLDSLFIFTHPDGNRVADLAVQANYTETIADNTTPAEADVIRTRVMSEAISRFDNEFRRQISLITFAGGWPLSN